VRPGEDVDVGGAAAALPPLRCVTQRGARVMRKREQVGVGWVRLRACVCMCVCVCVHVGVCVGADVEVGGRRYG